MCFRLSHTFINSLNKISTSSFLVRGLREILKKFLCKCSGTFKAKRDGLNPETFEEHADVEEMKTSRTSKCLKMISDDILGIIKEIMYGDVALKGKLIPEILSDRVPRIIL